MAETVSKALGGLGAPLDPEAMPEVALAKAVREGLPFAALERLIADGVIDEREVEAHFIPRSTLHARRSQGTLSREQGDVVVRLARVQTIADDVFGNRSKAAVRGAAGAVHRGAALARSRRHSRGRAQRPAEPAPPIRHVVAGDGNRVQG